MKKFWFPILILVVLIIGLVLSSCWAWYVYNDDEDRYGRTDSTEETIFAACVGGLLIVFLGTWVASYSDAVKQVAKMNAFFKGTQKAYKYAVEATQEIEIKAIKELSSQRIKAPDISQLVNLGDLAYLKLGEKTGERIEEFRDNVEWYNARLETYRRWNEISIARGFIPDVPSELTLITLE